MWLVQFSNPTLLCLIICIGVGLTLPEDFNDSVEDADDSTDFFDFPFSKLLKQMKQMEKEEEAEDIPDSVREKVPKTSVTIEPEAEMLPAHYTGVKSPGVDHMELVLADGQMENSDGDVYVISMKNEKNPKSKRVNKKSVKVIKKKSGKNPKGSSEHSQRRKMKTVRNYVYRDVFGEDSSEGVGRNVKA